ncbi:ester cyclase [Acinetobacter oleivorans]|uniref:Ester cyclase n=1 Tax=Acinetobacter oleivorans TaxID=1148157 RepID=A0ABR9NFA2_9GAMM|nr:ester cyclase [Acinetobacter oleivorans]MBE2163001.1 ester cyclase [Acinetobacter oleivorans]
MTSLSAVNKALVQEFYDYIQKEDYVGAAQLCHKDFIFYTQLDTPIKGVNGFVASEKKNFDAFNEFKFTVEHIFAEDDKVAAFMIFDGYHSAPLMDVPPKGNHVRFSLMMLLTVKDGLIIEKRAHFDNADILRQLTR